MLPLVRKCCARAYCHFHENHLWVLQVLLLLLLQLLLEFALGALPHEDERATVAVALRPTLAASCCSGRFLMRAFRYDDQRARAHGHRRGDHFGFGHTRPRAPSGKVTSTTRSERARHASGIMS